MSKRRVYIMLGLIVAFNLAVSPAVAQRQSACTPEQRKLLILTAAHKDGNVIDNLRAEHLSLKVGNTPATVSDIAFHARLPIDLAEVIYCGGETKARAKLQLEIVEPEMRKAKPILAYKRY